MQPQTNTEPLAHMTVVSGRPTNVLEQPQGINDLYVSCRTTSGDDAYVPLKTIFGMFVQGLVRESRKNANNF